MTDTKEINLRKLGLEELIDYIEKHELKDKIDTFIIRRLKQYRLNIIDFNINFEVKNDKTINRITAIVGAIDPKDPYDTDDYEDIYLDSNGSDEDENDEENENE